MQEAESATKEAKILPEANALGDLIKNVEFT